MLEDLYRSVFADIYAAPDTNTPKCNWVFDMDGKLNDTAPRNPTVYCYNAVKPAFTHFPPQLYFIPAVTNAAMKVRQTWRERDDDNGRPGQQLPQHLGHHQQHEAVVLQPTGQPAPPPAPPAVTPSPEHCNCSETSIKISDNVLECDYADEHALTKNLMTETETKMYYRSFPLHFRPSNLSAADKIVYNNLTRANILLPNMSHKDIKKSETIFLDTAPREQAPVRPFTDVLSDNLEPILRQLPYNCTIDMCPSLEQLLGYTGPQEFSHIIRVLSRRFVKGKERIDYKAIEHFHTIHLTDTSMLVLLQNHTKRTNRNMPTYLDTPAKKLREIISKAPRSHAPLSAFYLAKFAAWTDIVNLYCLLCENKIGCDHFERAHKGIFVEPAALGVPQNPNMFLYICSCNKVYSTAFAAAAHLLSSSHDSSYCCNHAEPVTFNSFTSAIHHIAHAHLPETLEREIEFGLVKASQPLIQHFSTLFSTAILPHLKESFNTHVTVIENILKSNINNQHHQELLNGPPDLHIYAYFKAYYSGQELNRERDYFSHMQEHFATTSAYMVQGFNDTRLIPDWLVNSAGVNKPVGLGITDHPVILYGINTLFTTPVSSKVKAYDLMESIQHRIITPSLGINGNNVKVNSSTHRLYRLVGRSPHKIHIVEINGYDPSGNLQLDQMARQVALIFHLSGLIQQQKKIKPMIILCLSNPGKTAFAAKSTLEVINHHRRGERTLALFCNAANLLVLPLLGVLQGEVPDRRHNRVAVIPTTETCHITPEGGLLLTRLIELFIPTWFYLKTRSPGTFFPCPN